MSDRPIRVLHIAEAFDPGGVVWWLIDVNAELPRSEVQADFLSLGGRGVRVHEVETVGSRVDVFAVSPRELLLGSKLVSIMRQGSYDIVHSHIFNLSGWLLRHAHRFGVPVRIAHFHTTHDGKPDSVLNRARRRLSRSLVSRHANVALGCTNAALDAAPPLHQELAREVVRYGIDANAFMHRSTGVLRKMIDVNERVPLIGHVGRFTAQKNHAGLLAIFAEVSRSLPEAHLALIGDGELLGEIRELATSRGLAARVHFLGARTNVAELLPDVDVFAFPSWWEGLGIVLIEARFAGIPVVASDLPSIRESLAGDNGSVLADPHDVSAFAAAVIQQLRDRSRHTPGAAWISGSSKEASAARLLEVYRSALARWRAA